MTKALTARGVKTMLTREGVDHSALTITDDPGVWVDIETGKAATSVKIEGPRDRRLAASHVLLDKGLSLAPYTEKDMWSRR